VPRRCVPGRNSWRAEKCPINTSPGGIIEDHGSRSAGSSMAFGPRRSIMFAIRSIVLVAALGVGAGAAWSQEAAPPPATQPAADYFTPANGARGRVIELPPIKMTIHATIVGHASGSSGEASGSSATSGGPGTTQPFATTRPALTANQEKKARELVKQLGDDDYQTREQATTKLILMGEPVQPLLNAKLQEKDVEPEVVERIGIIIMKTNGAAGIIEVTDEATGITVELLPPPTPNKSFYVQARRQGDERLLWGSPYKREAGVDPTFRLMNGQFFILPSGDLRDLATGRLLRRVRAGGPEAIAGQEITP
jgi:hypothetical protein